MNDTSSTVKRALLEIRELRAQLAAATKDVRAPIAIIGMALRLPGEVNDLASFERMLFGGEDPIVDIPADRWPIASFYSSDPDAPGKMTTRQGGFIESVDRFDAAFFGISPVEAASMDPQQRLLLEIAWEAVENSGVGFDAMRSSHAGVYVGMGNGDYGRAIFTNRQIIDPYFATGTLLSVAAGRLSYTLGLTGPALTVDTACSASLASLHLACQALRLGECDAALAGGINLILSPEINVSFTKGRMMSPAERCRTFDADADGYVRGEGAVMFLLKRLDDAKANGDRVLAIVRGTALNQDGRSSGLTAPSGPAQQAVIRAALANAGAKPDEIVYAEAHGTGTPLGDPVELGALSAVFAPGRPESQPLLIGALKSVIGHTEAASGAAGVAKCIVAFTRDEIPPNWHFDRATPHVDWEHSRLSVVSRPLPLPRNAEGRSLVGVSSFGISGTNAHVILEAPPPAKALSSEVERPIHLLALSAKHEVALEALTASWASAFETNGAEVPDLCHTANVGRAHFEQRLAVVGRSHEDFASALRAQRPTSRGSGNDVKPHVAFLYTGQGANFPGMGLVLFETSPVFRASLEACARAAAAHLKRDLLDVMFGGDAALLEDTTLAQPATFALQVALTELWKSWGVTPSAALGHSLGEYAAAWAGGMFSLSDAMAIVAARGRAAAMVEGQGAMAAIYAPPTEVKLALAAHPDVEIAVYNGPEHVVVSGPLGSVSTLVAHFETQGRRARVLRISFASHARTVEPALPILAKALEGVSFGECAIAVASNVSGAIATADEMRRAGYWLEQMRQPVRFAEALNALAARGVTHFIELGPHPSLLAVGTENLGEGFAWLPSMRREGDPWVDLTEGMARLYADGADLDWRGFDSGYARARVAGPTYPFQRQRYWIEAPAFPEDPNVETAWRRACAAADTQAAQGPLALDPAAYGGKWAQLGSLGEALTIEFLHRSGLFLAEEGHTLAEIVARCGVVSEYADLFGRWLDRLVSAGRLARRGDAYAGTLADSRFDSVLDAAQRALSDNPELYAYARHCADLAPDVLTGRESALETLFPGGDFALADGLYECSSTMRYANALAAACVAAFASSARQGRKLRVLEVGAGTGATTSSVLPVLPEATTYLFTDVSNIFLDRARERFGSNPNVKFGRFDLDLDLETQGYAPQSFDIVISANAVHACTDLRGALERLGALLAPGGVLVLVESTTPFAWFDFTTRLIEGWRVFDDDIRSDEPLLSADAWRALLLSLGFTRAEFWPRCGGVADALGQHLILAQAPVNFAETVATFNSSAEQRERTEPEAAVAKIAEKIAMAPEAERLDLMRAFVRDQVMAVLRADPDDPPSRQSRLTDLGLDSLMAVQLRNRLRRGLRLAKPPAASVMFDHPTIEALARYCLTAISPAPDAVAAPVNSSTGAMSGEAVGVLGDAEIEALLDARARRRAL